MPANLLGCPVETGNKNTMPTRSLFILALGVVIAAATAYSIKNRMGQAQQKPAAQVLVAINDIPAGTFVRAGSHIAMTEWPEANISESMLPATTTKADDYEGAVARRAISKGEPILKNMLVKSNEGGFMSAVLEPGKRAVSIAVDLTTGNAGFIFPGDRVDLILTHAIDVNQGVERASETFVEDVRVLAVDQMLDNPENKAVLAKTVTLEVTPKQAEAVNVAKDLGKISVSLRSLSAQQSPEQEAIEAVEPEQPITLDDMLHNAMPEPYAGNPPALPEANITRDTDVSKVISPRDGAGSRVRVLRGGQEAQDIEFNRDGAQRAQ